MTGSPIAVVIGNVPATIELRTKGVGAGYQARTQLAGILVKADGPNASAALFRLGEVIDAAHRVAEDYTADPDHPYPDTPPGGPFR